MTEKTGMLYKASLSVPHNFRIAAVSSIKHLLRLFPVFRATADHESPSAYRASKTALSSALNTSAIRRSISAPSQTSRPIASSFSRISSRISARLVISPPIPSRRCPSPGSASVFAAGREISASIRRRASFLAFSRSAALSPSATRRSSRFTSAFSICSPLLNP